MRKRTKILLLGFGGVSASACILAGLLAVSGNVIRERYSSYSDAANKDAEAHGMVPTFLPRSAIAIAAKRDLDADTLIAEFTYGDDFDINLSGLSKSSTSLPAEILEATSLDGIDGLEVFSDVGADGSCASHLVIDKRKRRAAYIYNLAPHRVGCTD